MAYPQNYYDSALSSVILYQYQLKGSSCSSINQWNSYISYSKTTSYLTFYMYFSLNAKTVLIQIYNRALMALLIIVPLIDANCASSRLLLTSHQLSPAINYAAFIYLFILTMTHRLRGPCRRIQKANIWKLIKNNNCQRFAPNQFISFTFIFLSCKLV